MKRSPMPTRSKHRRRDPETGEPLPNSGFPANVRMEILLRDRECVVSQAWPKACGGRLHAHHVWLKSQGGRNAQANGLTLCTVHHEFAHRHPGLSMAFGVIVPSWSSDVVMSGVHASFRRSLRDWLVYGRYYPDVGPPLAPWVIDVDEVYTRVAELLEDDRWRHPEPWSC